MLRAEFPGEIEAVRTDSGTPGTLNIARELWLTILSAAGPRRFRLIELPTPEASALNTVAAILERAVVNLRCEWRDAIAKAREVVEGLIVELAKHWNVPQPTDGSTVKWSRDLGNRLKKQLARRSDKRRALRLSSRQRMVLDRRGAPLLSFDDLKAYRSRIRARLGYGSTHACCRTYRISSESDRARIAVVSRGFMPVLLDEEQLFRGRPVDRLHPLR